jgi:hypothetical protein
MLVPPTCRIFVGDLADNSVLATSTKATIGLIDGSMTSSLSGAFEGIGVMTVYYTRRMRRRLPCWDNANITVPHQDVGGVTQYSLRFGILCKRSTPRPSELPEIAPRDVSTVLSALPQHYTVRKAPVQRHTDNKECLNFGIPDRPVYHGGDGSPEKYRRVRGSLPQESLPPRERGLFGR